MTPAEGTDAAPGTDLGARAAAEAAAAAAAAGVEIGEVALPDELDELRATMGSIWGTTETVPPRNLLRGMALGGACLLLARSEGRPVGFALGWLGWTGGVHLHSHQVGDDTTLRRGGVGYALKLAQRAVALAHGIDEMRWTFDPLLATNARFNLVRLGAEVVGFVPHCYGERRDAFNTGDTTDRLKLSWRLDRPVGGEVVVAGPDEEQFVVPRDYLSLRASDPAAADEVRAASGRALAAAFAGPGPRGIRGWSDEGYVIGASVASPERLAGAPIAEEPA